MVAALTEKGYDVNYCWGLGTHSNKQGGAMMPEMLRWLWRDYPKPVAKSKGGGKERQMVTEILDPESEWEVVSQGHEFTEGPAVDRQGNVFFSDIPKNRIYRIGVDGKVSIFKEDTGATNGLMFGPSVRASVLTALECASSAMMMPPRTSP